MEKIKDELKGKLMGGKERRNSFACDFDIRKKNRKDESNVIARVINKISFRPLSSGEFRLCRSGSERCCSERCNDESPLALATLA